jgi:hypothetical protein
MNVNVGLVMMVMISMVIGAKKRGILSLDCQYASSVPQMTKKNETAFQLSTKSLAKRRSPAEFTFFVLPVIKK